MYSVEPMKEVVSLCNRMGYEVCFLRFLRFFSEGGVGFPLHSESGGNLRVPMTYSAENLYTVV